MCFVATISNVAIFLPALTSLTTRFPDFDRERLAVVSARYFSVVDVDLVGAVRPAVEDHFWQRLLELVQMLPRKFDALPFARRVRAELRVPVREP